MKKISALLAVFCAALSLNLTAGPWVTYEGKSGPGLGRHVILLSGDEEYRSEEGLPQLAKILSQRHGFKCSVLFSQSPADGTIDPNNQTNVVGLSMLPTADLVILQFRFRELPDRDMKYFVDYLNSGKPILGLRTATHSFAYSRNKKSPYAKFDWQNKDWPGGFGQQVLGETWVSHHGHHGKESTRGIIEWTQRKHPILRGVSDVWGPTDVYGIEHLPKDATVLLHGQVIAGMKPGDPPVVGPKNNPMMPLAWVRHHTSDAGKSSRIFTTTLGSATDLENEGVRRLLVNATYWGLGMEEKIPASSDVELVGEFKPTQFGFGTFKKGILPAEHELK